MENIEKGFAMIKDALARIINIKDRNPQLKYIFLSALALQCFPVQYP
jgi:hypothetical protein